METYEQHMQRMLAAGGAHECASDCPMPPPRRMTEDRVPTLLLSDDSAIEVIEDERRDVWLTEEQKRQPRRVPTTRELFDAVDRKRQREAGDD